MKRAGIQSRACFNKHKLNNNTNLNPDVHTNHAISTAIADSIARKDNDNRGKSLLAEEIMRRNFFPRTAFKESLTMGKLQIFRPALEAKENIHSSIGHSSHLVADYINTIQKEEKDKIVKKINERFDEFSTTIDGSPIGNEAEAVSLTLANKK